jgi:FkbM family methyltransferase
MRKIINKNIESSFNIEYLSSTYNKLFWDKVETGQYEPDVQFTLKRCINSSTIFFDVGAAEGCMSLISASLGAQVIAYEPFQKYFGALSENVRINPEFSNNIKLNKAIVSNFSGRIQLNKARGKQLSSINYNEIDLKLDKEFIPILDLSDEILKFSKNARIVIKIDIEGAEYSLLSDLKLLTLLNTKDAILILAIHPGFFREIKKSIKLAIILQKIIFLLRNCIDNFLLFKKLNKFATVCRSNDVKVNSAIKFVIIAGAGVYEYNIYFNK